MRVTGQVLSIEPYAGSMNDRETGEKVSYSGERLNIFDGREVVKVKVKARQIAALGDVKKGDDVDLVVDVVPGVDAGRVYLVVSFVELVAPAALHAVSKAN